MNFCKSVLLAVAMVAAVDASACTAFAVGRKASATGRVMVGHNNDGGGAEMRYILLDANKALPAIRERGRVTVGGGRSPKIYWQGVFSDDGLSVGDVMLNEHGVFISSNHGGFYEKWDGKKGVLPEEGEASELTGGGLGLALRFEIARCAKSAFEGIGIATNLIAKYGYCHASRTFLIADKDEAWALCVVRGKRYAARRCPDDAVMAFPNFYPIERIRPGDIVSANIAAKGVGFDFAAAYQGPRTSKDPTQCLRRLEFYRVSAGVTVLPGEDACFVRPAHPVSVEDLKRGFSSHFEGSVNALKVKHPKEKPGIVWPICRDETLESVICSFGERGVDARVLLARGRPCETPYDDFRPFLPNGVPAYFFTGDLAMRQFSVRCP